MKRESTVSRRAVGGAIVGLAALGAGGWYFGFRSTDDPAAVAASFVSTLDEGDFDSATDYLHPESPISDPATAANMLATFYDIDDFVTELSVEVIEQSVLDETETSAQVELRIAVDLVLTTLESDVPFELRTHDGDWYVWNIDV